ncbi:hypothetical protein [Pseudarthrobacter sulfonivorans]|uniref:hypothetical protein n=1 Tax=Pseudarthrobacter sulfonivorans TaxID=121292 RepID=UPI002106F480|nr:hypothetical protein [Pseudarthrobacter sulfonivorans]
MLNTYKTLLRNRNTRFIITASFVNSFGSGLFNAVVVLFGISRTDSAVSVTLGLTSGAIGAVLLTPLSAKAVRRYGARPLVVHLALLRALICFLMVLLPGSVFSVLLALHVVLERFTYPGSQGVLNYVAEGEHRSATLSLRQLINTLGLALGAWCAAATQLSAVTVSPLLLIVLNGVSFILNAFMYRCITMPLQPMEVRELSRNKTKAPIGLIVVSLSLAIIMSGGAVVTYGLPLIALGNLESLQEIVPLTIAIDVSIGALIFAFVTPHIRSIQSAAWIFACSAALCITGVIAFGSAVAAGKISPELAVGVTVVLSACIALASFSAYFLFSSPEDSTREPRYMAAFGLSGTMTRLVYPTFVAFVVSSHQNAVIMAACFMVLAAVIASLGMKQIVNASL